MFLNLLGRTQHNRVPDCAQRLTNNEPRPKYPAWQAIAFIPGLETQIFHHDPAANLEPLLGQGLTHTGCVYDTSGRKRTVKKRGCSWFPEIRLPLSGRARVLGGHQQRIREGSRGRGGAHVRIHQLDCSLRNLLQTRSRRGGVQVRATDGDVSRCCDRWGGRCGVMPDWDPSRAPLRLRHQSILGFCHSSYSPGRAKATGSR